MLLAGTALPAHAEDIKITTWNLEWATTRASGLPKNVKPKSEEGFAALKSYAGKIKADVVGFQEVDGADIAHKVFDPSAYEVVVADENDVQRVGFAIRKGIQFKRNPDLAGLDLHPTNARSLRRGVDVTISPNGKPLRMLVVHLKSGCWDDDLASAKKACTDLNSQVPVLKSWVAARQKEGVPFVILGDFNRRFDAFSPDPMWNAIGGEKLARLTEGRESKCWGGEYKQYIDHIVVSADAKPLVIDGSFEQTVYAEGPEAKEMLSDHCPISVKVGL